MLNDPMLIAEMIAEKRDQEDEAWRARFPARVGQLLAGDDHTPWMAQYEDLKAREAWHEYAERLVGEGRTTPFADCPSLVCRGIDPIPEVPR